MFVSRIVLVASILCLGGVARAADGCRFEGPLLYCLDGDRSLDGIVRRFASDATAKTLQSEAENFERFDGRAARERYRVSVERNNARAVKFAKQADRLVRRGHISSDEYERRMAVYRAAYRNYRMAIGRYQASYWFDPVEDASDGIDLPDDAIEAKG